MTPQPTPIPLTYANMADLLVPIYYCLALLLAVSVLYIGYIIAVKPWLRSK